MILQQSKRLNEVWREVRSWPFEAQVKLATRILQSMDETVTAPLPPSDDRRQAIEQLIGFAKTDAPLDDAAVDQILLEERLKKYG